LSQLSPCFGELHEDLVAHRFSLELNAHVHITQFLARREEAAENNHSRDRFEIISVGIHRANSLHEFLKSFFSGRPRDRP